MRERAVRERNGRSEGNRGEVTQTEEMEVSGRRTRPVTELRERLHREDRGRG